MSAVWQCHKAKLPWNSWFLNPFQNEKKMPKNLLFFSLFHNNGWWKGKSQNRFHMTYHTKPWQSQLLTESHVNPHFLFNNVQMWAENGKITKCPEQSVGVWLLLLPRKKKLFHPPPHSSLSFDKHYQHLNCKCKYYPTTFLYIMILAEW